MFCELSGSECEHARGFYQFRETDNQIDRWLLALDNHLLKRPNFNSCAAVQPDD